MSPDLVYQNYYGQALRLGLLSQPSGNSNQQYVIIGGINQGTNPTLSRNYPTNNEVFASSLPLSENTVIYSQPKQTK